MVGIEISVIWDLSEAEERKMVKVYRFGGNRLLVHVSPTLMLKRVLYTRRFRGV